MNSQRSFLAAFRDGDVGAAKAILEQTPGLLPHAGYRAHPLLHAGVTQNDGHCYRKAHLEIAELLIPAAVCEFRDAVLGDRLADVGDQLAADPPLATAEFTAGRGIAQAIHHWQSTAVAQLLLEGGADIDVQTTVHFNGDTPLSWKLRTGDLACVRFLLERGADPNRGPIKFMPSAAMTEAIPLLLGRGWDIDEGAGQRTLLHHDANPRSRREGSDPARPRCRSERARCCRTDAPAPACRSRGRSRRHPRAGPCRCRSQGPRRSGTYATRLCPARRTPHRRARTLAPRRLTRASVGVRGGFKPGVLRSGSDAPWRVRMPRRGRWSSQPTPRGARDRRPPLSRVRSPGGAGKGSAPTSAERMAARG